jgi:hypothetical protein
MLLNSKFDVLRGFPKEGAIDETFEVYAPAGVPVDLPAGSIIYKRSDGTVDLADTPDRTSVNGIATWVVVEGNDDYSGSFLNKVVAVRANAVFKLDPANFTAAALPAGAKLTMQSGIWTLAVATNQIIGEVLVDDQAVDETITVYYSGGDTAML